MALPGIPISEDQCIGDSLNVINQSFQFLDTRTVVLTAGVKALSSCVDDLSASSIFKPAEACAYEVLTFNGTTNTWVASAARAVDYYGNIMAWATFDGTTSPCTVIAGSNIFQIAKESEGNYTVTFANHLPDANYAVLFGMSHYGANGNTNYYSLAVKGNSSGIPGAPELKTTAQLRLHGFNPTTNAVVDCTQWYFAIIR